MRQVKYRLWCNNKKEWEKDAWHLTPDGRIVDSKRQIEMKSETHFLNQFTGLFDKQGAEIYEGDILKSDYSRMCFVVKYDNNGFCLCHDNIVTYSHYVEFVCRAIIGNIYENPELLHVKE